jgi:hypothetical protein
MLQNASGQWLVVPPTALICVEGTADVEKFFITPDFCESGRTLELRGK